jgi:hypothetical protein
MSSTRFDTITKKVTLITSWLVYFVVLCVFTEIAAGYALEIYRKTQRGATDYTILDTQAKAELREVQGNANLNLYRWYSNLENFRGQHVITDASGFRINSQAITNDEIVGMFGGSTTFSVITTQEDTIPDLLSNMLESKQVLNFGVGGYSTGAEIMTFVEALRVYPTMTTAVFYDGVNELIHALEQYEGVFYPNSYEVIGAPYFESVNAAISNSLPLGFSLADSNLYYIYQRIHKILNRNNDALEIDSRLEPILNRYFDNIKVLSAICSEYKVKCIFAWQPSLFTTLKDSLSERELELLNETTRIDGFPYIKLSQMVFEDNRSEQFGVVNLTGALDLKPSDDQYFYDWVHINADGNRLVARAISNLFENE